MLVFFGTSPRSARFLDQAIQNGLKVDLVVSSPAKPVGKKQTLTENPTVTMAKKLNIPYLSSILDLLQPSSTFHYQSSDIGLILDFNKIIPAEIINLFPKGIVNIHFSKLPQYRGPSPVQHTILNGDKKAWITYYLINETVDAGKIIAQTSLPLDFTENTGTLYQKLIEKSAAEITSVIDDYLHDRYHPCQQTGTPTYTKKLKIENCRIDWTKSPEQIERLIRAAYPEPGAWTEVEIQRSKDAKKQRMENSLKQCNSVTLRLRLKILKARLENGQLVLDQVQLEGKNPVTWKQFQQGYPSFSLS